MSLIILLECICTLFISFLVPPAETRTEHLWFQTGCNLVYHTWGVGGALKKNQAQFFLASSAASAAVIFKDQYIRIIFASTLTWTCGDGCMHCSLASRAVLPTFLPSTRGRALYDFTM